MQELMTPQKQIAAEIFRPGSRWRFVVGAAFLAFTFLFFANNVMVAAEPTALSTPELIDRAYENGEISADERLLHLAYAVYEPDSLPPQFQSDVPWFGTDVVAELNLTLEGISIDASTATAGNAPATMSVATVVELNRLMKTAAATVCDRQDAASTVESANFHLNYGSIGGGLNAQSYLDALGTSYDTEVSSYDWAKPPYSAANPWGKYPVQVVALPGGLYGYVTSGGGSYTGLVGDNPNTAVTESNSIASCMVLNVDYSGFPGGAQFSLNVTTAHEFVHSIQFGYGDPAPVEDVMWYESSAAYMEDEVFDAANDNYQYLWPQFDACLGEYPVSGILEYSNWPIFRYAAERNGGANTPGGGEDVMQQFFANVAAGQRGQAAYDNALASKGANLKDTFHDYAIASRFMKSCPSAAPYCFEEAAGYVAAKGALTDHGGINSMGGAYNGSLRNNYAINWVSLPTSGSYSVKMANSSVGGQFRISIVADTGGGLQVTSFPGIVGGNQTVTLPSYTPPNGAQKVVAVITNQQTTGDDPISCTANPYRLSTGAPGEPVTVNRIFLPLVAVPLPLPGTVNASEDTTILQGYATQNFCDATDMWAGYDDLLDPDGKIARSLVKFDLSMIPAGTSISKATIIVRHVGSWDFPDRSQTITAYAANSSWAACTTTWNSQPSIGAAYGSQSIPFDTGGWYEFDITSLAQSWISGSTPNNGIWLRGPEFSGPDSSWRSFGTVDSSDAPYLSITYPGARVESTANALHTAPHQRGSGTGISMIEQLESGDVSGICPVGDNSGRRCLDVTSE